MGFLTRFTKAIARSKYSEATTKRSNVNCDSSTSSSEAMVGLGKDPASKSKKSSSTKSKKKEGKSANIAVAEDLLKEMNSFTNKDHITKLFVNPEKAVFKFEDGFALTPQQWAESLALTWVSFPNMKFEFESIKETGTDKVLIEGLRFSGTHTGEPFTFAPQVPAIPAAGVNVQNDEETLELRVKGGKIDRIKLIAMGTYTGPIGIFEQIGGRVVAPTSTSSNNDD